MKASATNSRSAPQTGAADPSLVPAAPSAPAPLDGPAPVGAPAPTRGGRAKTVLWWITRFALALFLFIGALQLMKTGAKGFGVLQPGGWLTQNAGSSLGLGWIGALLVLSGSPVAATSLTLVASSEGAAQGVQRFSEAQGFTMLTGSRLGAAFVVLVTAVIYAMRGGSGRRKAPISTAVIALSTTAVIYLPAAALGLVLLRWGPYSGLSLRFPGGFADVIGLVFDPILERLAGLPPGAIFVMGLLILLASFKLIDSVMPSLDEGSLGAERAAWLRRKWPMFGIGCAVALITMSVSVALTVLVPLVARGYAKREDVIPYIMGANITTLGDTMLAAFALNSPAAVRIVLAEVIATSILSVLVLAFAYPQLKRAIWRFQRAVTRSRPRTAAFTAALFLVPITVVAISGLAS